MKNKKAWLRTAGALLFVALLSGCGGKPAGEPFGGGKSAAVTPAEAMAGASDEVQALYKQNCLSCHGGSLEGKVGPATNLQKIGSQITKEQIVKQITSGGNGMPGFGSKLKPEETEALADWLAAKK